MRASQPYFPSISLVLSQAERPIHLPNHLPKLLSQQQVAFFPVSHEDYMQTVDERDYISYVGLDVISPEIPGGGGGSVGLHENLPTNEVDNPTVKGKRLKPSSLVIGLVLAMGQKHHQICVKERSEGALDFIRRSAVFLTHLNRNTFAPARLLA